MNDDQELVMLVDELDREAGFAGKLSAHRLGQRHRAISVCLFDSDARMLVQRRASGKYHSGRLWTNTCCTHSRPGESAEMTAERRLFEELGIACRLRFLLRTQYCAPVGNGLLENEIVHVFHGDYEGTVEPDPKEVAEVALRSKEFLLSDIAARPEAYSYWFKHYILTFGDLLFDSRRRNPRGGAGSGQIVENMQ